VQPAEVAASNADIEPAHEPAEPGAVPLVPIIVTAAGVALIGAGIGFGLAADASEDDYAKAKLDSRAHVDSAIDDLDRAQTQALLSNIGFIAGGAVTALGVVLLALELGAEPEAEHAQLVPEFGPGRLGLALHGHFGGTER
jgi:hypothetical protein